MCVGKYLLNIMVDWDWGASQQYIQYNIMRQRF